MKSCGIFLLWVAGAAALPAQTFTTLFNFNSTDGGSPVAGLVQGPDGNFYGTTYAGGPSNPCEYTGYKGCGTVFRITPSGTLTTLYNFCSQTNCTDGFAPDGQLVQGADGNFYGTAYGGGASDACVSGCGTVFKITPSGALTTLHGFD